MTTPCQGSAVLAETVHRQTKLKKLPKGHHIDQVLVLIRDIRPDVGRILQRRSLLTVIGPSYAHPRKGLRVKCNGDFASITDVLLEDVKTRATGAHPDIGSTMLIRTENMPENTVQQRKDTAGLYGVLLDTSDTEYSIRIHKTGRVSAYPKGWVSWIEKPAKGAASDVTKSFKTISQQLRNLTRSLKSMEEQGVFHHFERQHAEVVKSLEKIDTVVIEGKRAFLGMAVSHGKKTSGCGKRARSVSKSGAKAEDTPAKSKKKRGSQVALKRWTASCKIAREMLGIVGFTTPVKGTEYHTVADELFRGRRAVPQSLQALLPKA